METKIEFSADTVSMSFEQLRDGSYHIQPYDKFGQMTGDYHVTARDLRQNFPSSLVDYIRAECELEPNTWHSVPLQRVFDIPLEFKENQQKRQIQRYHNKPSEIKEKPIPDELSGDMVRAARKEGAVIDEDGRFLDVASANNPTKVKDSIAEFKERLEKRPINLGVSFIEFKREPNGIYEIRTNIWLQNSNYKEFELMDEFHVAEKNLDAVLPPAVAEYVRQASKLNVPIGEYDSHLLETEAWKYGWHAVPIQHKLDVPQEYAQELNRIALQNEAIVPNRINNTEISSEQQDLLRQGELVIVKGEINDGEKKTLALWIDKEYGFRMMEVPDAMKNAPLSEIERLTKVPTKVNGVSLSDEQRMNLADGKVINIPSAGNPSKTVGVKMSNDGQPLVVPPVKQAHKQEPAKPGRRMR